MTAPKNLAASVNARLQNVAPLLGERFNLLLTRYGAVAGRAELCA